VLTAITKKNEHVILGIGFYFNKYDPSDPKDVEFEVFTPDSIAWRKGEKVIKTP